MPNWVYNGLTAQGPHDSIKKMKDQLNTPFVDYIESKGDLAFGVKQRIYSNPIFSFRNIIAPTDLEAYKAQPVLSTKDISDPDWWADNQRLSETDNSWYNWNIRNWGVKWDVAVSNDAKYPETYMEEHEDEWTASVYYNFNTAWGVADVALVKLSSQYPDILFTLSFEEETGWGGEWEILRGEIISQSEYETQCKDCDETDCVEYCEDCQIDVCSVCFSLDEADPNDVESCETHKQYLKENA